MAIKENFSQLIEENKLKFYKTAKIILKNDDDVYDALQEALLSIYQNYSNLNDKKLFSTWGTRIVINKCYDLLRKYKHNTVTIDEVIENNTIMAQYDEYDIDKYGIKKALEALSEEQKLITILYYYDDYSIKEISNILDIPEGTAKSRLAKSREILKKELEKEEI